MFLLTHKAGEKLRAGVDIHIKFTSTSIKKSQDIVKKLIFIHAFIKK